MRIIETAKKIDLTNFSDLPDDDLRTILAIRNEPAIRDNMFTDHEISQDEHFSWIASLKGRSDCIYYSVAFEGQIVGAINLVGWAKEHRRADWAFYLSSQTRSKGVGSSLELKFLDMVFGDFQLKKLNCEVLEFNQPVIGLHKKFGFQDEGMRRDHIIRDGEPVSVQLLGLTDDEWRVSRARFTGEAKGA